MIASPRAPVSAVSDHPEEPLSLNVKVRRGPQAAAPADAATTVLDEAAQRDERRENLSSGDIGRVEPRTSDDRRSTTCPHHSAVGVVTLFISELGNARKECKQDDQKKRPISLTTSGVR